jgi:hypothetical protein
VFVAGKGQSCLLLDVRERRNSKPVLLLLILIWGGAMQYRVFRSGQSNTHDDPYSPEELEKELTQAKKRYFLEGSVSFAEAIDVLERVGAVMESASALRAQVLSYLDNAGFSKLDQDYLMRTVRAYLSVGNLRARWKRAFGEEANIFPAGLVAHIGATNTILGGLDGLIDGIITGNFNILKLPTPGGGFPGLFVEALYALDTSNVVKKNVFAFWWKGGDKAIESTLKQHVDRVVVWGGQDAVLAWKSPLATHAQVITHGPKYGIGVITKAGLDGADLSELARSLAWDICSWDQRACNSIQGLFVESKIPKEKIDALLQVLGVELDKMALIIPPIRDADDYVEILKARELWSAEEIIRGSLAQIRGESWTINLWRRWSSGLIPSCLYRYLQVMPFEDFDHLAHGLWQERILLQTLGHCASPSELPSLRGKMGKIGISRICPLGRMPSPVGTEPHDGNFDLRLLSCVMADQ